MKIHRSSSHGVPGRLEPLSPAEELELRPLSTEDANEAVHRASGGRSTSLFGLHVDESSLPTHPNRALMPYERHTDPVQAIGFV